MKFCPKCGKRLRLLTGRSRGQAICPRLRDPGERRRAGRGARGALEGRPCAVVPLQRDEAVPEGRPRPDRGGGGLREEVHHPRGAGRVRQVGGRGRALPPPQVGLRPHLHQAAPGAVLRRLWVHHRDGQVELHVPGPHQLGAAGRVQQGEVRGGLEPLRLPALPVLRPVRGPPQGPVRQGVQVREGPEEGGRGSSAPTTSKSGTRSGRRSPSATTPSSSAS